MTRTLSTGTEVSVSVSDGTVSVSHKGDAPWRVEAVKSTKCADCVCATVYSDGPPEGDEYFEVIEMAKNLLA